METLAIVLCIIAACCLPMLVSLVRERRGYLITDDWPRLLGGLLGVIVATGAMIYMFVSFVSDPWGWMACLLVVIVGRMIVRDLKRRGVIIVFRREP
jgi:hypothetical protein